MGSSSYRAKQMIVMRRDLKMRKGKIAAQAGHACVEAVLMALAREGPPPLPPPGAASLSPHRPCFIPVSFRRRLNAHCSRKILCFPQAYGV